MPACIDENIPVPVAILWKKTRVKGRKVILSCTLRSVLTPVVRDDQLLLISTLTFCAQDGRVVKQNISIIDTIWSVCGIAPSPGPVSVVCVGMGGRAEPFRCILAQHGRCG